MIRSLWNAASGLRAGQIRVDTVAHNVANINTPGYRRAQVDFADLLYETAAGGRLLLGNGVRPMVMTNDASPGPLEQTGNTLDLAIDGQGYFVVQAGDGALRYTRDGSFKLDGEGRIVTSAGLLLRLDGPDGGLARIPPDARELTVDGGGAVTCVARDGAEPIVLGRIRIACPLPAASGRTPAMLPVGGNLFVPADGTTVVLHAPGQKGSGAVRQGWLERSNVVLADELVELITAQRAFELNSRAVQTADQMLSLANGIRRG